MRAEDHKLFTAITELQKEVDLLRCQMDVLLRKLMTIDISVAINECEENDDL